MTTKPGFFVVIEGIDGAGTTTQSGRLAEALRAFGRRVLLTGEPSQGPAGLLLRQILAGRVVFPGRPTGAEGEAPPNEVMALLFAADRMDHLVSQVRPWLASEGDVVCDRYTPSSIAYQGGDNQERPWVRALNQRADRPHVTYLLDLPAEVAADRRRHRSQEELYEALGFQRKLVQIYRELVFEMPEQAWVVLNGQLSVPELHQVICRDLASRFTNFDGLKPLD